MAQVFVSNHVCNRQVLNVIGDEVLKHVATRVTVDGTAPEGSPVEASQIQIDSSFVIPEHAPIDLTRIW